MQLTRSIMLSVAGILITSTVAHGSPLYDFHLVGPGNDITFSLPASPTVVDSSIYEFNIDNVTFVDNGVSHLATYLAIYSTLNSGGLQFNGPGEQDYPYLDFSGDTIYSGPESHPTFLTGSFTEYNALPESPANQFSLTISPATAVTPEPSSLALLGTGALGIFGVVRQKLCS